jgi:hypothetical protein
MIFRAIGIQWSFQICITNPDAQNWSRDVRHHRDRQAHIFPQFALTHIPTSNPFQSLWTSTIHQALRFCI